MDADSYFAEWICFFEELSIFTLILTITRMGHHLAITLLLFISFNNSIAQELSKKDLMNLDVYFVKRIHKVAEINDNNNSSLQSIYDDSNKVFALTELINAAIINNEIEIYNGTVEPVKKLNNEEILKLLWFTYDSVGIRTTVQLNEIIIEEIWDIDETIGEMTKKFLWFQFCHNKDTNTSIPIFTIKAENFFGICQKYYVFDKGDKRNLALFFKNRDFKSRIFRVSHIETRLNRNR